MLLFEILEPSVLKAVNFFDSISLYAEFVLPLLILLFSSGMKFGLFRPFSWMGAFESLNELPADMGFLSITFFAAAGLNGSSTFESTVSAVLISILFCAIIVAMWRWANYLIYLNKFGIFFGGVLTIVNGLASFFLLAASIAFLRVV